MGINANNGRLEGKVVVSQLIEYLNEHKKVWGDTQVIFTMDGDKTSNVVFDHFSDAITINLEEYLD